MRSTAGLSAPSKPILLSTEFARMEAKDRAATRLDIVARHLAGAPAATLPGAEASACAAGARVSPQGLLDGQVCVLTGAGQGIGAAAARLFAQHGAALVLSDLDGGKSDAVAAQIRAEGGQAISVPGDVTDPSLPDRIIKATLARFHRLDILINNAGYTWDGVIHKMSAKQWDAMLAVHCTAPFRLIQAAAPAMRDAAKAEIAANGAASPRCIINVSSVSGTRGSAGQANYATAKAGVVGLTKTVAREWGGFNIRCNCLAFGKIQTRLVAAKEAGVTIQVDGQPVVLGIPKAMLDSSIEEALVPLARSGTAEEAAGAMLLLALPYASFITGQVLEVNGGLYT